MIAARDEKWAMTMAEAGKKVMSLKRDGKVHRPRTWSLGNMCLLSPGHR
jgi:hypothetical protein